MRQAFAKRTLLLTGSLSVLAFSLALAAQQQTQPLSEPEPVVVLHAYTNQVQVPVLVLSESHQPLPPIPASKFAVSLDGGPPLRPTHVRREEEDPISLSILLDVSESGTSFQAGVDTALAGMAQKQLHAQDRVSLYVLDCSLTRYTQEAPARSSALGSGAAAAVAAWKDRERHTACRQPTHFWDALAFIAVEMNKTPSSGRQVILAISDGHDHGSKYTWNQLRRFAASSGIGVFGMRRQQWNGPTEQSELIDTAFRQVDLPPAANSVVSRALQEDLFQLVCQLTGGLVLQGKKDELSTELARFISMIRGRYIVEFPRNENLTAGRHGFDVTVAQKNVFVRPCGKSHPPADPAESTDPSALPRDPSNSPQPGERRMLPAPNP